VSSYSLVEVGSASLTHCSEHTRPQSFLFIVHTVKHFSIPHICAAVGAIIVIYFDPIQNATTVVGMLTFSRDYASLGVYREEGGMKMQR
jgi:hypothetical protein